MSDVLLFSPPYIDTYGGLDIKRIQWAIPPYGIACIGGYLKSKGIDTKIYDLTLEISRLDEVIGIIKKERPEYVGIGTTSVQVDESIQMAAMIKDVDSSIKVIIGGPHATSVPEKTIEYNPVDIIVLGDGEETMKEICSGKPLNTIKGIYYKDEKIFRNGPRPLNMDLNKFPFPLYEQLPMGSYGSFYFGQSMGIISGRGCPYKCTFCASKIIDKGRYRFRNTERIIEEMNHLYLDYGYSKFSFWDDTFTLRKERVTEFCEALLKNKYKFKWTCNTHVNAADEKIFGLMEQSGCKILHIGIESANDHILDQIKKGTKINRIKQAIKWSQKYNFIVYGFFIIGFPNETRKDIMNTINFACEQGIDLAQFSLLTPLPGTDIWSKAINNDGIRFSGNNGADIPLNQLLRYGNSIIELPTLTAKDLDKLFSLAYRKFYFRPIHLLKLGYKFITLLSLLHFYKLGTSFFVFFKSKVKK